MMVAVRYMAGNWEENSCIYMYVYEIEYWIWSQVS